MSADAGVDVYIGTGAGTGASAGVGVGAGWLFLGLFSKNMLHRNLFLENNPSKNKVPKKMTHFT